MKNYLIAEYEEKVEQVIKQRPIPSHKSRNKIIEELNEDFYQRTEGKNLPNYLLSKLADWILIEELSNRDIDKVSKTEFAILSHRQLRRRDKRERLYDSETVDFLNQKYVKKRNSMAKIPRKRSE